MRRRFIALLLAAAALPLAAQAQAGERHLRTLQPQHVLPEQVAPVLAAQVGPGSSVTPYGNQLILNVTDTEFRALRDLLQQLDGAPRSLLIAVRDSRRSRRDTDIAEVNGRWGNDRVEVRSGGGQWQPRNTAQVRVEQRSIGASAGGDRQVRAVEGMAAYIGDGALHPVDTGYGGRELVPVESGFYATARVVGDEVIVDIDQRDDRAARGVIRTSGLRTQVRGRLGEWIPLGGVSRSVQGSESGLGGYRAGSADSVGDVAIKVELLN
jgi:hypothetical protein